MAEALEPAPPKTAANDFPFAVTIGQVYDGPLDQIGRASCRERVYVLV